MIMMLSHVYMHMCIKAPLPLLKVFSPVLSYLPSISRGESPVFSRPLCFVVFPPFSLSQLLPICRFHFLNTSFLLTLRFKHPCCICFHIALVFSHPLCYVVTFTLSLSWFSPICRIFITLMSSIKNLMKRQTGFASFQQSKVLYGRMSWDWSISYNMVWHGMIVKAWYISMVWWAR